LAGTIYQLMLRMTKKAEKKTHTKESCSQSKILKRHQSPKFTLLKAIET